MVILVGSIGVMLRQTSRTGKIIRQMETEHYDISVVVLTYNRKDLLFNCLESLFKQTHPPQKFEIIVIDDGSTDQTCQTAQNLHRNSHAIKYIRQKHQGVAAARNTGIAHAKGSIIAFVADDYVVPPNYVATIARFFRDYKDALVVRFKVIGPEDTFMSRVAQLYYEVDFVTRLRGNTATKTHHWSKKLRNFFARIDPPEAIITKHLDIEAAGAAAFKKEVFNRVGIFDTNLKRAEDSDMAVKMRGHGIHPYYNPRLRIVHKHSPHLIDHLRKCFSMGDRKSVV